MELIFELLLQLLFEFLAEYGTRIFSHSLGLEKPKNPFFAAIGYVILAGILALISLYFLPTHFLKSQELRLVNLAVAPILLGLIMGLRGKLLIKKQKEVIRLDSFAYGYLFAITFGAIRFFFAN